VLLTRSRLSPRPKPGSSLHLHVLGTPPAFVLSQDQTLREELQDRPRCATCFTKSRRGPVRHERTLPPFARWVDLGPVPGGIRPLRPHEGTRCTPTGPGTHDGVSIWHRRSKPVRASRATASNLDTHLDRGFGRRVRMLLSFQRPSHLFGRGFLPGGRVRNQVRFRSGPVSIALSRPRDEAPRRRRIAGAGRVCVAPCSGGRRPCYVGYFGDGLERPSATTGPGP
jgi:hypothetical protein